MKTTRNCLYNSGKGRLLDTYRTMVRSYFVLCNHISDFFMKIENVVLWFTHLAKIFKWLYQNDPLLKTECKAYSSTSQFNCKYISSSLWSTKSCRNSMVLFNNETSFLTLWFFEIPSIINLFETQCLHHLPLSMIEDSCGFVMLSEDFPRLA